MDVAARIIVMLLVDRSQPEPVTLLNSRSHHQEALAPAIRANQLGKVLVTELVEKKRTL